MSFAESQMAKFGWKQGEGLGKHKDGIKKSISVVKKNDTKGVRPCSLTQNDERFVQYLGLYLGLCPN